MNENPAGGARVMSMAIASVPWSTPPSSVVTVLPSSKRSKSAFRWTKPLIGIRPPSVVRSTGEKVTLSTTDQLVRTGGPAWTLLLGSLQPSDPKPIPAIARHKTISGDRRQNSRFMESSFTQGRSLRDGDTTSGAASYHFSTHGVNVGRSQTWL